MEDWLRKVIADANAPSVAAKRAMENIARLERQWQEAFKPPGYLASFERLLKDMAEPSEAAKRFMENIERSVRQSEEAFKMLDASWLKELSEPLKLYVPPEPTCRLALADQFEVDDTPPCGGRRVGFEPWE